MIQIFFNCIMIEFLEIFKRFSGTSLKGTAKYLNMNFVAFFQYDFTEDEIIR
jgi:hypothetical protein